MSKTVKNRIVKSLETELANVEYVIVADISSLSGNDVNMFRRKLADCGIAVRSSKASFIRNVLVGARSAGAVPVVSGSASLIWGGEDIVALSREITRWAKDLPKISILGGAISLQTLTAKDVDELSRSPGRVELLSKIAGIITCPGGNIVSALTGPGGRISGGIVSRTV